MNKVRKNFDHAKEYQRLSYDEKVHFEFLKKKFTQLTPRSLFYIWRTRKHALEMCIKMLDDTRAAGEAWLFFATGAIKTRQTECINALTSGTKLYQWLDSLNKDKPKRKKVLTKRNTNNKRKVVG